MKTKFYSLLSLSLLISVNCSSAWAAAGAAVPMDAKVAPARGHLDAAADQLIHKVSDFYAGLQGLSGTIQSEMHVEAKAENYKNDAESTFEVKVQRPNKLMFAMKRGKMGGIAVSDGRKASLYSPQLGHGGSYATADAPADLATLFGKEEFLFVSGGMSGFSLLEALVAPDPYSVLMSGVTGVSLAGTETIDGVETQHIHFKQKDLAWDMWVDTGAQPWVRRVIPDMTAMLSHYSQSKGSEATMTLVLTYKNLAANPTFADSDFQFVAPAEARQVDSFFTADAENVQSGARGMLHKPAPAITLDTLDGGKFDLSSFKGKNIVVIDFWATWCPPCRASLPILAEVTKEYEPKGVRFFAINIREEPEKVSKFLESQNLKINVALDKNADAAKAYNVMGIPQTVVIDPDGIVRDVHLGFEDNLKQSMADQLDIIMTGIKETGQKNK